MAALILSPDSRRIGIRFQARPTNAAAEAIGLGHTMNMGAYIEKDTGIWLSPGDTYFLALPEDVDIPMSWYAVLLEGPAGIAPVLDITEVFKD